MQKVWRSTCSISVKIQKNTPCWYCCYRRNQWLTVACYLHWTQWSTDLLSSQVTASVLDMDFEQFNQMVIFSHMQVLSFKGIVPLYVTWELPFLGLLPGVRWEDQYHFHFCYQSANVSGGCLNQFLFRYETRYKMITRLVGRFCYFWIELFQSLYWAMPVGYLMVVLCFSHSHESGINFLLIKMSICSFKGLQRPNRCI